MKLIYLILAISIVSCTESPEQIKAEQMATDICTSKCKEVGREMYAINTFWTSSCTCKEKSGR